MIQATLTTGTCEKKELVKVPIFIYLDKYEAEGLARLILEIKPTYLINCSNSIESLKNHVKKCGK